jgi:hypothetical protein
MADHGAMEDRRRHPRANVCASAVVLARHNRGIMMSVDRLSISGASLAGPLSVDRGEHVQIMFEIDGHPIELTGLVIRVEARGLMADQVAVEFVDVPEPARALIDGLVTRTLEREGNELARTRRATGH